MISVIRETLIDSIKILPFLFVTYLAIEYIEHKSDEKLKSLLKKSSRFGPIFGSIAGVVPQCGFSAAAANFYAGRIITLGTLIAVFLSTSDEMLPILISSGAPVSMILQILLIKVTIGIIAGVMIDSYYRKKSTYDATFSKVGELCEREQCHCEESGIFVSAAKHAISIFVFILVISLIINIAFHYLGNSFVSESIFKIPIIGELVAGLIGIIPNCAASVLVTQLYLKGVMSFGAMLSGLLAGAGTGLIVLFKVNVSMKENIKIAGMLYVIGVVAGCMIELLT